MTVQNTTMGGVETRPSTSIIHTGYCRGGRRAHTTRAHQSFMHVFGKQSWWAALAQHMSSLAVALVGLPLSLLEELAHVLQGPCNTPYGAFRQFGPLDRLGSVFRRFGRYRLGLEGRFGHQTTETLGLCSGLSFVLHDGSLTKHGAPVHSPVSKRSRTKRAASAVAD
jgi:hypothetical protein